MLRALKEVQADDSIVGFYQGMALGVFLNQSLVEMQAIHQEKLRHGGIVVVHGAFPSVRLAVPRVLTSCGLNTCRHLTSRTRECNL